MAISTGRQVGAEVATSSLVRIDSPIGFAQFRIWRGTDPELFDWARTSGLTLEELALIQPAYGFEEDPIEGAIKEEDFGVLKRHFVSRRPTTEMLCQAISLESEDTVEWLLENGADPNGRTIRSAWVVTPSFLRCSSRWSTSASARIATGIWRISGFS